MALDAREIDALRRAAALLAAVPDASVRVRTGSAPVLDVGVHVQPSHPGAIQLCPVGFRRAVAGAMERTAAGGSVALRGVPQGASIAVDVRLPPGSRTHPGGVHEIVDGTRRAAIVVTTAPCDLLREVLARTGSSAMVVPDAAVDARLVVLATAADEVALAVEELRAVIAAVGVDELERWLDRVAVGGQ